MHFRIWFLASLILGACQPGTLGDATDTVGSDLLTGPLPYRGVSLSVAEFGYDPDGNGSNGTFGTNYTYPDPSYGYNGADYFIQKGMTTFRLPFRWERLQPTRRQAFDAAELTRLKTTVNRLVQKGAAVLLDPHNYARYHTSLVGSSAVSNADFADFWSRLAAEFKGNTNVLFGLCNEPHDMPTEQWLGAANAAIAAIRSAGASNLILVSGNSWDSAMNWSANFYGTPNATALLQIQDPQNNLAFEAHQYLDGNASGTDPNCVSATVGSERLKAFTSWLKANGKKGFIGELGGGTSPTCLSAIDDMLKHIEANQDVYLGWAFWAAGPWWGNSWYSLEPDGGVDKPQMTVLAKHLGKAVTMPPAPPATCTGATYEAESITHSTGGATSGGWNLWSNGYLSTNHNFSTGATTIKVTASGSVAANVWPQMSLAVGGVTVGTVSVASTTWKEYSFSYDATAGTKEIRVSFTNDYYSGTEDRNLLVDKIVVSCPAGATGIGGCGSATGLVIGSPLALDKSSVTAGQTLTGKVTYKNCTTGAIALQQAVIAARPPGGTHAGGPYDDLAPLQAATTIASGATLTVTASRAFTASDPIGGWISYATWQDSTGAWHDGPDVAFSVASPDVCGSSTGLVIEKALALDKSTVVAGQSLGGSVTYKNCSSAPIAVQQIVIAGRPPGGTHAGGPYDDFGPAQPATTIAAGASLTVTASRAFSSADPAGAWISFATWQDSSAAWHDGPDVSFSVAATTTSGNGSNPTAPIAYQPNTVLSLDSGKGPYYAVVPSSYDSSHKTPTKLIVWLHGCGGDASWDVHKVSPVLYDPPLPQSWLAISVGGETGSGKCWNPGGDMPKVLAAIDDMGKHFDVDLRRVILGGYSSGGDIGYPLVFQNANRFAGMIMENTAPFDNGYDANTLIMGAAWKFNIVQLVHTHDTTYPPSRVRAELGQLVGFPVTILELEGSHYDNENATVNGVVVPGTDADLRNLVVQYMAKDWVRP